MLPRLHRLRQTKQIQKVVRSGRCFNTPYVRVCLHAGETSSTRIACVVGKSVDKSAVRRHRYQRWLRQVASDFVAGHPSASPYDMVWIAQPAIANAKAPAAVAAAVIPHLQKIIL